MIEMTEKPSTFALVIEPHRVAFFEQFGTGWRGLGLSGEKGWLSIEAGIADPLPRRLQTLNDRINSEHQLGCCRIWVLCAEAAYPQLPILVQALTDLRCRQWQLLQLEPLLANVMAVLPGDLDDTQWLRELLLPRAMVLFQDVENDIDESAELARQQAEHDLNQLQRELLTLQQEKRQLQATLSSAMQPDREQLLSFLPVIFENFWSSISPADVGLLMGQLTMPEIPSPFPEPAENTVLTMKRRFLALPLAEREKIIRWCRSLSHPLKVRNTFKVLLLDTDR